MNSRTGKCFTKVDRGTGAYKFYGPLLECSSVVDAGIENCEKKVSAENAGIVIKDSNSFELLISVSVRADAAPDCKKEVAPQSATSGFLEQIDKLFVCIAK
jgi:hypothetical protein